MFWYYFNHDNSFAYRSDDGQLAPSEVLKLGANIIEISMEQKVQLPAGCEDEEQELWILDDGTVGLKLEELRVGSKRYTREAIDILLMYASLDEVDRPEHFQYHKDLLTPLIPNQVMDRILEGSVVSDAEKLTLLELCNAI